MNPIVVVEVLSETTEAYDRGAKAAHYRRIPSLQEYVLVAQSEPLVEVYRRNERDHFELIEARSGEHAELASLGVRFAVVSWALAWRSLLESCSPYRQRALRPLLRNEAGVA